MENGEGKEIISRIEKEDIAPLEHTFFGSTSKGYSSTDEVINDLRKGVQTGDFEALRKVLTPWSIESGEKTPRELVPARRFAINRRMLGYIIDEDQFLDLSDEGISPFFELSELDPETGKVIPEWKIFLGKKGEVIDDPRLDELILPDNKPGFELLTLASREEGVNFRVLKLKNDI